MRSDSWQLERDFVPATLEEAAELRRAIVKIGHSRARANEVIGWLLEKRFDGTDSSSPDVRSRNRKVLASLNGSYPGPRRRQRVDVTPPYVTSPRPETPELEEAA